MISRLIIRLPAFFAPITVGAVAFFLVIGPGVLDPTNVAWLSGGGDTTQHYLGWAFYRYGPWTLPLGLNPQFGLEISSSIVFSDSIPLMAFLLKPFSLWLPEPFQYLGIWMLICFILQAFFAWLLIGLFSSDAVIKLLGTALIIFAPPMLFRLVVHIPLASHFIVLAALYLALRNTQQHRILWWTLLLCISVLINFYLLAMVLCIWLANIVDQLFINKKIRLKAVALEVVIAISALGFTFWQAGYLALESSSASWGLGFYRMNVLSIINPMGWSYMTDYLYRNTVAGEYEGFNYLGLGLIVLAVVAILKIRPHGRWCIAQIKKRPFFLICLLALTLYSFSHQIGVGPNNFSLGLPQKLHSFFSTLRSSGRLFWPVWYVLVLTAIYVVIRNTSKKQATGLLFLVLLIQVADTSAKWWPRRTQLSASLGPELSSLLRNPFWREAASHYPEVVRRPLVANPPDWNVLAQYAAKFHMGTDSVYLARIDEAKVAQVNQQFVAQLSQGQWNARALYAVDNTLVLPVLAQLDPTVDVFARIDGQNIFAPGWKQCATCPKIDISLLLENQMPKWKVGQTISFDNRAPKKDFVLTSGWWQWPESWGTWSTEKHAQVNFLIPQGQSKQLTLYARALIAPNHASQRVQMTINGQTMLTIELAAAEHNPIVIPITTQMRKQGYLSISFEFLDAISPRMLGMGGDDRLLAIGLESARFD